MVKVLKWLINAALNSLILDKLLFTFIYIRVVSINFTVTSIKKKFSLILN